MEELQCKGTPAQVMRRVLAVLAEDPDLLWQTDAPGATWSPTDATILAEVLGRRLDIPDGRDAIAVRILRGAAFVGERMTRTEEPGRRVTTITRGTPIPLGVMRAEQLPGYVLVKAMGESSLDKTITDDGTIQRDLSADFAAFAPTWERVKSELERVGLVAQAAPTEHTEQAPQAAPAITETHPPKSKGGRPRLEEDDWAYAEIGKGRPKTDVYNEWRLLPAVKRRRLEDTQQSFDSAMKSRAKKQKGTKPGI